MLCPGLCALWAALSLRSQESDLGSTLGNWMEVLTLLTVEHLNQPMKGTPVWKSDFCLCGFSGETTRKINAKSIAVHIGGSFSFHLFSCTI